MRPAADSGTASRGGRVLLALVLLAPALAGAATLCGTESGCALMEAGVMPACHGTAGEPMDCCSVEAEPAPPEVPAGELTAADSALARAPVADAAPAAGPPPIERGVGVEEPPCRGGPALFTLHSSLLI